MDSKLQVESTYDVGSRFYFALRQGVVDSEAVGKFDLEMLTADAVAKRRPEIPFYAPGARILIVDDTPMNLQVIAALLKRTGMKIDTASSGAECIELFDETDYDIVFLDYRMPGLDGIETIKELSLRFAEKFERTPVICLTASAVSGDRERLLEAGFDDYLTKPVNVSEMENTLRAYLPKELQSCDDAAPKTETAGYDLPEALIRIGLLDVEKGIEYCGDEEDYVEALKTYRDSVNERSAGLEETFKAGDIEAFSIAVHSLKSMSIAVGAVSIGDMAKELELAGKDGDIKKIEELLPGMLADYRSLLPLLTEALK